MKSVLYVPIFFLLFLSGCSLDVVIHSNRAVIQNGSLSTFSTTTNQNIKSTGFARVKATGGAMTYGSVAERTQTGAIVYHHVQGTILANEVKPNLAIDSH